MDANACADVLSFRGQNLRDISIELIDSDTVRKSVASKLLLKAVIVFMGDDKGGIDKLTTLLSGAAVIHTLPQQWSHSAQSLARLCDYVREACISGSCKELDLLKDTLGFASSKENVFMMAMNTPLGARLMKGYYFLSCATCCIPNPDCFVLVYELYDFE